MRIGLCVFPRFQDTHFQHASSADLGQRLEPSVLYLASDRSGDTNVFIADNDVQAAAACDVVLCSVYTRGLREFQAFARAVGRNRIIAGGYHPSADPTGTHIYARTVVTGLTGNIEEILDTRPDAIIRGKPGLRRMRRDLIDQTQMRQVYPDVRPGMLTGRSTSSVGCPFDCDFCATPALSDRTMHVADLDLVAADVADLKNRGVKALFVSDESFTTRKHLQEVAWIYGGGGFETLYSFGTATTLTAEKLRWLADAGWHSLNLGLEDIGVAYRKNKDLGRAIGLCREAGIGVNLSFIVNDYQQPRDAAMANYAALYQAWVDYLPWMVSGNFLMPFPGTAIWDTYKHAITEDQFVRYDSKTPLFADAVEPGLAAWHQEMMVAVQLAYYYSDAYNQNRVFACGDNLHLRFIELEQQFGMDGGRWQRWTAAITA